MGNAPSTAASQARPCATVVLRDDGMSSRYVSGSDGMGTAAWMTVAARSPDLTGAAMLGGVSGLRTFTAPAVLALRGRLARNPGRYLLFVLGAGELLGDKHPAIPARSDPPALAGRLISGALAGRAVAGNTGAGVGAAGAAATTYVSERTRAALGQRTGIPDALLGLTEDGLAIVVCALATRRRDEPVSESRTDEDPTRGGHVDAAPGGAPRATPLGAVAHGLVAAAVGTAAMTSVQTAYLKRSGAKPSSAPGEMGQRIVKGVLRRRVARRHRDALNQAMHALYGTSWGLPFGLVVGSLRQRPRASTSGGTLGVAAWTASLVGLPALGLAPAPWQQSPGALTSDLSLHLVYGAATGAAHRALGG